MSIVPWKLLHISSMSDAVLAKTAQGASFMILLQVVSRALTFAVNQFLLRLLTPQILGVATQLELFSISILYFSRESIRVAVQRQGGPLQDEAPNGKDDADKDKELHSKRMQDVVNLSWVAIILGAVLTFVFEWLYVRRASAVVLDSAYIRPAIRLSSIATVGELLLEPSFAIAQHQMMYGVRASSELQATFARCIATCACAFWGSRQGHEFGALPFAFGQVVYVIVLNLSYFRCTSVIRKRHGISILPRRITPGRPWIPSQLASTAGNLYGQSLFKQLLTSGDQYLVAVLAPQSSQGSYALASNYGGLLARVLFQPIEESSRSLFARLLPSGEVKTAASQVQQAITYLTRVLHAYLLLSIFAVSLGPPLAWPAIHLLLGSAWSSTEAPQVLASYCYYIPMLAVNGLLEAFVAAVATPTQLRVQSLWMVAFSIIFAVVGAVVLGWFDMGARGLIIANVMTMTGRILWSWNFINGEIKRRGGRLTLSDTFPNFLSLAVAIGVRAVLERFNFSRMDLTIVSKAGLVLAGYVLAV